MRFGRRPRRRRATTATPASTLSRWRARDRAVPAVLGAARPARAGVHAPGAQRGADGGETDNRKIVAEILGLRTGQAHLLGFKHAADPALEFSMAKTPATVHKLCERTSTPTNPRGGDANATTCRPRRTRRRQLQARRLGLALLRGEGARGRFDVDDGEVKPYLQLDNVIIAAFDVRQAVRVRFKERPDLPVPIPTCALRGDRRDSRHGLFLARYLSRPSKRSARGCPAGASSTSSTRPGPTDRRQRHELHQGRARQAGLLSLDDARTLFRVRPWAARAVPTSPTRSCRAQRAARLRRAAGRLSEHWLMRPEVLSRYGRPPRPASRCRGTAEKLEAARNFNQGFATVEYAVGGDRRSGTCTRSEKVNVLDVDAFERETLDAHRHARRDRHRHRIPHFQHIIGGYRRATTVTCGRR